MKALIVDDEQHARENLRFILGRHCPEVTELHEANSVDKASDMLDHIEPDVIFLDISMPEKDGFHLLASLDTVKVPVIFVTAHDEFALKAVQCGPTGYILKPINAEKLKEAVKRA